MAPRDNNNHLGLPPGTVTTADYTRDLYRWSQEQAQAIRDGRWDAIDRENVAEEIESVGKSEFDRLVGALRGLMLHVLLWDRLPEHRSRSRAHSIGHQRNEIRDLLNDSPSLHARLALAMTRGYRQARIDALQATELDDDAFPATCPYSFDDLTARRFSP